MDLGFALVFIALLVTVWLPFLTLSLFVLSLWVWLVIDVHKFLLFKYEYLTLVYTAVSEYPLFTCYALNTICVFVWYCVFVIIFWILNAKKLMNRDLISPVEYNYRRRWKTGGLFQLPSKKELEFSAALVPYFSQILPFGSPCAKCNTKRTWNIDGCCEHCKYK